MKRFPSETRSALRDSPTQLTRSFRRSTLICAVIVVTGCGENADPVDTRLITVAPASSLVLDDARNAGDASDFTLEFTTPQDEASVLEYRVILVSAQLAGSFTQAEARGLASDRYQVVGPGAGRRTVELAPDLLSSAGTAIQDGETYVAVVLTVGTEEAGDTLSAVSNEQVLAVTSIKITYLGNAGVMIEDDSASVIIDALTGSLTGWIAPPANVAGDLRAARPPFDGIGAVLVTHNHGDHFSPSAIQQFLGTNSTAVVVAPSGARSGLTASRVAPVDPQRGESERIEINGITIDVLHVRHFDLFGNDFRTVDNYAYVVHLGGKKVAHLGDVHYSVGNLGDFGLDQESIDVVVLPAFDALLSASSSDVIQATIAPTHVVAMHFQSGAVSTQAASAVQFFGARAFTIVPSVLRF